MVFLAPKYLYCCYLEGSDFKKLFLCWFICCPLITSYKQRLTSRNKQQHDIIGQQLDSLKQFLIYPEVGQTYLKAEASLRPSRYVLTNVRLWLCYLHTNGFHKTWWTDGT